MVSREGKTVPAIQSAPVPLPSFLLSLYLWTICTPSTLLVFLSLSPPLYPVLSDRYVRLLEILLRDVWKHAVWGRASTVSKTSFCPLWMFVSLLRPIAGVESRWGVWRNLLPFFLSLAKGKTLIRRLLIPLCLS